MLHGRSLHLVEVGVMITCYMAWSCLVQGKRHNIRHEENEEQQQRGRRQWAHTDRRRQTQTDTDRQNKEMIAAVYCVSLTDSAGDDGKSGAVVLHRRWCPASNAAGSLMVVEKFFKQARTLTAEAIAEATISGYDGGVKGISSSMKSQSNSNSDLHSDLLSADTTSLWSLNVLPTIVETDVAYVVFRRISDAVLLMASCQIETSPMMVAEFLKVFHDTLVGYMGVDKIANLSLSSAASSTEEKSPGGKRYSLGNVSNVVSTITNRDGSGDAFIILAAQLLDEMVDGGFPIQTEISMLKSLIAPPTILNRMAAAVTGQNYSVSDVLPKLADNNIPWRRTNVKYASNEIYFDIEEQIDAIFDSGGMLVTCDIHGVISINSKLSGFPDLLVTLTVRRSILLSV